MGAPVVWFEVAGRDLATLTSFYEELFGWKVDANNPPRYGLVDTGAEGGIPGGIFAAEDGNEYVTFYVDVPDIKAAIATAETLGAKTVVPPSEVMGGATVALINDPEGHALGLIQQP